jgi:hypothetical protein
MLLMSRQFNKVAEESTLAVSPVAALSEQEVQILRLFASGKLPRNCEEPRNQPSNSAQSPSPHQPEAADTQSPGSGNA